MKRSFSNYLINDKLQIRLCLKFLSLIIFFSLYLVVNYFIIIWPIVLEFIPKALIFSLKNQIIFRLYCFGIVLVVLLSIIIIIFLHRIAGPVYHIESAINEIIKGNYPESIKLRKKDELKGIADKLNQIITKLKEEEEEEEIKPD